MRHLLLLLLLPVLASGATSERAGSQIQYAIGQNAVPVYEGWTRNADGTATMTFGYMNRNYEEELDIPVGADNRFEPGEADRGQPTHFHIRRQMFVFDVIVPKDWGARELVWSLTAHGRTDKAFAALTPGYELSDVVIRENRLQDMGQGGGEPNARPSIGLLGPTQRSTDASTPVSLTVSTGDDGFPTPRPRRGANSGPPRAPKPNPVTQAVVKPNPETGLTVTWVHYRGRGQVTFSPASPSITAGRATTTVRFGQPGTYVLRAYADDSVLTASTDVTIVVTP